MIEEIIARKRYWKRRLNKKNVAEPIDKYTIGFRTFF